MQAEQGDCSRHVQTKRHGNLCETHRLIYARIERKKRRTSLQRCAERKKFAKRRERSLAFLLFTECVKETEYKGLIKIK